MKLESTQDLVEFIFKGIELLCMVLRQELCMTLLTSYGRVVKKPGNLVVNQPIFGNHASPQ
jgi:hypothetical protein